jgi:hypothetical protein
MGFQLYALVGKTSDLRGWTTVLPAAVVCQLGGHLGLVPLTDPVSMELESVGGIDAWAMKASAISPIAYLDASEWAEESHEEATIWSNGTEVRRGATVEVLLKYFQEEAGVNLGATPIQFGKYRSDDAPERWAAAGILDELVNQTGDAVTGLVKALRFDGQNESIREYVLAFAAKRLGKEGPVARAAIPALIAQLSHPEWTVRIEAVEALGKIGAGSSEATHAVTAARNDSYDLVRKAAEDALGTLSGDEDARATTTDQRIPGGTIGNQSQQLELEAVYNGVRASLESKDFDAFTMLVEPAVELPALAKSDWLEGAEFLLDMYPDLANTKFQRTNASGERAGYYTLTELDDPNFINIMMFKFHRAGSSWKLSGSAYGMSFPSTKNAADDEKAIAKELDTNPKFRLAV